MLQQPLEALPHSTVGLVGVAGVVEAAGVGVLGPASCSSMMTSLVSSPAPVIRAATLIQTNDE